MKITVIGCGNAFSKKSYNQSFLIEEDGRKMLIDCGRQTPEALYNAKIDIKSINDIYISHAHADHCGGLEDVAFTRYDWITRPRHFAAFKNGQAPRLIANSQLLKDLWNKTLRGGLESMEGFVATIETFFETVPVEPNTPFEWQGWTIDLKQQVHIMSGSIIMPSFGIMFSKPGHKTVYFVTDSQHCSPRQMEEFYRQADIIFQDCECTGVNFQFEEGSYVYKDKKENIFKAWPKVDLHNFDSGMEALELSATGYQQEQWQRFKFGSGVHANYAQLAGYPSANSIHLPAEIKVKMWLSHYQDFVLHGLDMYGNPVNWEEEAKKDGFAGFVKLGQEMHI